MVPNQHGFLSPAQSAEELVALAPKLKLIDSDLDIYQLQNKDSTNVSPEDWELLINKILELYESYDGFFITHGTDTMTHTATAVAFATSSMLNKPIVFTGAQSPISVLGTDALTNLERSLMVLNEAIEDNINEVMIVFSNRVLRASRTIKRSEFGYDAFDSPAFPNLGLINAAGIDFMPESNRNSGFFKISDAINKKFLTNIMTIDTKPGLNPKLIVEIAKSSYCDAIILRSYGAGIVPSEGKYSLIPAIKEAVNNNIPIVIATKFVGGKTVPTIYQSGQEAIKAGAILAGDMTDVATEVKLAWLMGQGIKTPDELKIALTKSLVGEIS